ncbi:MAG: hypothetical protein M1833_005361 [Piccolia ochrophora]|nr:MAG: hypothetical protein M1833_005361 [Piccolia ochrophora]
MASLLGNAYESSDEERPGSPTNHTADAASSIVAAPDISLEDPMRQQLTLIKPTDTSLTYNITYDDLSRPQQGPADPFKRTEGNALKRKNVLTGYAEEAAFSDATFTAQHRTFQSLGYSKDPSANGAFVGDTAAAARFGGLDVVQMRPRKEDSEALRRKRQRKGDPSIVDGDDAYKGPWARYQDEESALQAEAAMAGEELASDEEYVEDALTAPAPAPAPSATAYRKETETTAFHGESLYDYQGRTYMHVPQDLDIDLRKEAGSERNFIPKKLIHTFTPSHNKPITALRFFPSSGHLLLSAAADGKACLWDAYHARSLLRSYTGHTRALTDAVFSPTGTHLLTASFDRAMKLWDTETGACVARFSTGKIPHVVRFNPAPDAAHEFLAGMSDKKIIQFDTRLAPPTTSADDPAATLSLPTQEYDHHLAAVNTLTFTDAGRRFLSTSDDKSLRAWEYNIPVPIKYIAEPYMFALNRACLHPSGKSVAYQSGDNQIVVYAAGDKFRQNRKKAFRGHNNAGYAIDVDISPDGALVASGDSAGWVCFWDWKTGRMWHKLRAQDKAVTCLAWHPRESSKLVTGGVEGVIKYWD